MKVYTKGLETKRSFVLLTYRKLREESASSLTVRKLAKELGYSPAVLYRYFESLDELIAVASVHFLNQYMQDYAKLLDSDQELLDIYLEGWNLFNQYAFERPDIYYGLFWGGYNTVFANAIIEYYELFPFSGSEKFPAYYYTMLFTDSIYERDYQMLHRSVNQGVLRDEEARFLSRTNPIIVRGLLEESIEATDSRRNNLREECDRLLRQNLEHILKKYL